jgi:hypothetical protein
MVATNPDELAIVIAEPTLLAINPVAVTAIAVASITK